MILINIEKEASDILQKFNNLKNIYENKIKSINNLNIYDDLNNQICEIHDNFYNYHKNYDTLRNILNNILECKELNLEDIQLQTVIDDFFNAMIQFTELINNNYSSIESCLDNALITIVKTHEHDCKKDNIDNLLNNVKLFKQKKTDYFYFKFFKSLLVTYKEYIYFIENRIQKIFDLEIGIKKRMDLNYI